MDLNSFNSVSVWLREVSYLLDLTRVYLKMWYQLDFQFLDLRREEQS